jgi:hypothetical protein
MQRAKTVWTDTSASSDSNEAPEFGEVIHQHVMKCSQLLKALRHHLLSHFQSFKVPHHNLMNDS